jgi:hypothetical protein
MEYDVHELDELKYKLKRKILKIELSWKTSWWSTKC